MLDPGGHRPQRPCARGWTCAKQEQAQGVAPGQIQNRTAGGTTTSGGAIKQAREGFPTDADGGRRVNAADDTLSRNAAKRARPCNLMRKGGRVAFVHPYV